MTNLNSLLKLVGPCALIGAATLTGCSGGGSSSSDSGSFALLNTNVKNNTTWQINRQMQFKFSQNVDFATVNLNSISISQVGGGPATGEFLVGTQAGSTAGSVIADPQVVVFQPACPKLADYSDAGLLPGGVSYVIDIKSGVNGIRSTGGQTLSQEQTIAFTTPNSTQSSVLFMDPQVGPPLPRIYNAPNNPPLPALTTNFTYIEIGNDPNPDDGIRFAAPNDPILGSEAPADFLSPLNLYSSDESTLEFSHVAIVLELNQPVNPSSSNVNSSNIKLEYLDGTDGSIPSNWKSIPHDVKLAANCTATGARLRITPIGILPQGRTVRIVITPDFKDLVSDSNPIAVVVGSFKVNTAYDPGSNPPVAGPAVDEVFESFSVDGALPESLEDTTSALPVPRANWSNGQLSAAFAFGGTGGPGGNFDWQVGDDSSSPVVAFTLDTTFTLITDTTQQHTESVINGLVDVHNFTIKPNGKLTIQGQNPCKILASGTVTINGQLLVRGTNNPGVTSFDSTNIAEPGASGQAGGGKGGAANYNTSTSTPIGEAGYGAFNTPGGGGGGGESGYSTPSDENTRRPGGGGGGTFGVDLTFTATPAGQQPHPCADQTLVGLDAEPGFGGAPFGNGALSPIGSPPKGGPVGTRPFFDGNNTNDFWGTMLTTTGQLIQGELAHPWAGAGGGGGGNACDTGHFPTTPFSVVGDEKGAAGGGGGGSLTILALGDIIIGRTVANTGIGLIDASGGTGGGGENTNNLNHVGGGSGGGSGGHIILQTASTIDFTRCKSTTNPPGGIYALGGQGGQGFLTQIQDGAGGAQGGFVTNPWQDALPGSQSSQFGYAYPAAGAATPCAMKQGTPAGAPNQTVVYGPGTTNTIGDFDPVHVIIGGGGDGGPGIIQLHAPTLDKIKPPLTPETFYKILKPVPIGTTLYNINLTPTGNWNRLLPTFGPMSQALSKWIPLGAASVDPVSSTPKVVSFFFDGTNATTGQPTSGLVKTSGTGASATVTELPSIIPTNAVLAAEPALPFISADKRSLVVDSSTLTDAYIQNVEVYTRNPSLLKHFVVKLTQQSSTIASFEVASASFDAGSHQMRLSVSDSGMPLSGFAPGDAVAVIPRFFRVATNGMLDNLPQSTMVNDPGTTIKVEFQATTATLTGAPDLASLTAPETDIKRLSDLTVYPNAASFRFIRFQITFNLLDNGGQLTFQTPIPSLEFFRLPFKF